MDVRRLGRPKGTLAGLVAVLAGAAAWSLAPRGDPSDARVAEAHEPVPTTAPLQAVALAREPVRTTPHPPGGFPGPPVPPGPRWLDHVVAPGETLLDLAARYDVTRDEIVRWNRLDRRRPRLWAGQILDVHARRFPRPRMRLRPVVREGESWRELAARFGVEPDELRRANARHGRMPRPGARVQVFVDSSLPALGTTIGAVPELPAIPDGSRAVGSPAYGAIEGELRLPDGEAHLIRRPENAYGSSHALRTIQTGIAAFRHRTGYPRPIVVSDISRRGGGRLRPHRSHSSGRDVDLWLPTFVGFSPEHHPSPDEVDWGATWALVEAFLDTGEVEYVFLAHPLQKRLMQAARALGVAEARLRELVQWPRGRRARDGLVRHARGHRSHIHVRIRCGPDEPRCRS